jgi:hypothetical protein
VAVFFVTTTVAFTGLALVGHLGETIIVLLFPTLADVPQIEVVLFVL